MLQNKSIIIFGGSSGIGLAIAQAAAEEGANVTSVSRSQEKLNAAKEKISGNVKTVSLDINDESAVKHFFEAHEKFDHLVMTAGSAIFRGLDDMSVTEAKDDFDNFFWRAFIIVKYGVPKINSSGSILLTSGNIAAKPLKGAPILSAAANAIEGFAKALAIDIAPIRVNVLSPSFTRTPLLGDNPEQNYAEAINKLLIKRIAEPEEMAHSALYLLNNNYVTGQILRVEGGALLS
jgi:NAD(P)-dependent dehydrogenase (short-subunit alcohol dehydrogenase family)